jgi:hypothetical protein
MTEPDWKRWQRPRKEKQRWLEWQPNQPFKYVFIIFLCIWILPSILGLVLTPLGAMVNVLFVDWVMYKKESSFGDN